jgi:hypothetical protein
MVYDMSRNRFPFAVGSGDPVLHPIDLTHISHFLELNQVGHRDDSKLWLHTDAVSLGDQTVGPEVIFCWGEGLYIGCGSKQ